MNPTDESKQLPQANHLEICLSPQKHQIYNHNLYIGWMMDNMNT